jgi:CRISPR-associated exonuclease Cas4
MPYKEEDYLSLSGIQHFEFCRRQWALIHIEQQWEENFRTVEGNLMHRSAHDSLKTESRGNIIITRGMPVFSSELGIYGICDVVEFHRSDDGVILFGREGRYLPCPIEYKRGRPKSSDMDNLQLAAQAICLEEMLCCEIKSGFLFYGETRRRVEVIFTSELRSKVRRAFEEMHQYYNRRYTPKVKLTKQCNACSLKDICLPVLCKNKKADAFINRMIKEGAGEEAT